MSTRREDEEGISAGRFINPGVLPPIRSARLQGGRFVQPAADRLLPHTRQEEIEVDYDQAYHFGGQVRQIGGFIAEGAVPGSGCALNNIYASISGSLVTSVNVGAPFKLYVAYKAENTGGGTWAVLITAVAVDGANNQLSPFLGRCRIKGNTGFGGTIIETPPAGDDINTPISMGSGQDWVMPAGTGPLYIRVKMWINDDPAGVSPVPAANW
jgi:hypothetical protein